MLVTDWSKYSILRDTLNYMSRDTHILVTEEEGSPIWDHNNPVKFGLNWGAFGAVSVEKSIEFIGHMNKALEIAKELNKMEIVVKFRGESCFETRDEVETAKNNMLDCLENFNFKWIAEFLED